MHLAQVGHLSASIDMPQTSEWSEFTEEFTGDDKEDSNMMSSQPMTISDNEDSDIMCDQPLHTRFLQVQYREV